MYKIAFIFFVVAVVSAMFAYTNMVADNPLYYTEIVTTPTEMARFTFYEAIGLFMLSVMFIIGDNMIKTRSSHIPSLASLQGRSAISAFRLSAMFFVVALIAGMFGFGRFATSMHGMAAFLFWVFIVLFAISLLYAAMDRRKSGMVS